ncbi:unnamed protein product [Sphenostylis stenocarpa]|uniref:Uncharacterized protein n=1 Tax=Sphenostylis stenocarpa TaxID=92480 RepID=A0AA86VCU4_9FABA|nr:unnamed protein product [Sphenostylis stenocarpa]
MPEAILEIVLRKLASLAGRNLGLLLGFHGDKEKLDSMFTAVKAVLHEVEEKQFSDEGINWLRKLKDAAYELEDILDEMAPSIRRSGVMELRQTRSFFADPRVYGRDDDTRKIVNILTGDADASQLENLSVYAIGDLGGVGKTTVAQFIFNHVRVVDHFELRIWVCVSEDFTLKRMTKTIIEAASGHACEDLDLEPLQIRLPRASSW